MNRLEDIQALAKTLPIRRIPDPAGDYMERYQLHGFMPFHPVLTPCSVYLHHIKRADEDPALHSHPWEWTQTMVLHGGYMEERGELIDAGTPVERLVTFMDRELGPEQSALMTHNSFHRIKEVQPDTWTLFFTGPKRHSWGFYVEGRGVVNWRDRLKERGLTPAF